MNAILYLRGTLPPKKTDRIKASVEDCKITINKVIDRMTASMSDFQQQNITVDNMLAENALCKFYVAIRKGLLSEASFNNIQSTY